MHSFPSSKQISPSLVLFLFTRSRFVNDPAFSSKSTQYPPSPLSVLPEAETTPLPLSETPPLKEEEVEVSSPSDCGGGGCPSATRAGADSYSPSLPPSSSCSLSKFLLLPLSHKLSRRSCSAPGSLFSVRGGFA